MDEKIISMYLDGNSITKLSVDLDIPYCRIQKILRDNNITIRGGRKKKTLSPEQEERLKELFYSGIPKKDIAKELGVSVDTVRNFINERGYTRTNKRINKRLKSDYFSSIDSAEKAYWLGFLYTDGSVDHYRSTGRVRLQLQEADLETLIQYKEDLGIDSKLLYDKRPNSTCVSVEFNDEQIFNDLGKLGIIPNKTYESHHIPFDKVPEEYIPAFLLGLFDGDGSLTYSADMSKDVTLNFTSYYETVVEDFQREIDKLVNKETHNKNFFTSAWHTQWRGRKQVLAILDILYANSPRHLKRKYDKYVQLKNSLN